MKPVLDIREIVRTEIDIIAEEVLWERKMAADFMTCYSWMIVNEDSSGAHAVVPDACPEGCLGPCFAISGINSGVFPAEYAAILAIPRLQRGPAVQSFYETKFWNQWYSQLASDDVAKRVFDEAVNGGTGTAIRLLQVAINTLQPPLADAVEVDGEWGPNTVAAANSCDQIALVKSFITVRCAHYRSIYAANPGKFTEAELDSWLERAEK